MILNIISPQLGLRSTSNLGGEIFDYHLLTGLAKLKHKVHLLVPNKKRISSNKKWQVYSLHLPFIYPPKLFNYLFPIAIKQFNNLPNLIFRAHSIAFTTPGLINRGAPVVAHLHLLSDLNYLKNPTKILNEVNHLIVPSQHLKNQLEKITATTVTVIPNGTADYFHPPKKKIKSKHFRLLFVGQLTLRKNPLFLLKIINQLPSNFHLTIIGQGPLETKLRHSRIKIIPFVAHHKLAKYYHQANLFLFPSKEEGFGLTVAEAQASGLPALVADNSSLPERVKDKKTGFVLPLDSQLWIKKIKQLSLNPLKFSAYSASWLDNAKQTAKIYESLISR